MAHSFKRKLASILAILAILSFITACSKPKEYSNPDGTILEYTRETIPEEGGFFVKKGDTYVPILSLGIGTTTDQSNFLWLAKNEEFIPNLDEGDELVYISSTKRPETFAFSKLKDCGYTIGIKFSKDVVSSDKEGNKVYSVSLPTSAAGFDQTSETFNATKNLNFSGNTVYSISGDKFDPALLDEDGFLQNLTPNAVYDIGYYIGTYYSNVRVKADTHLFKTEETYSTSSYRLAEDIYIGVELPAEISYGYYIIDNVGVFKYNIEK